VSVPRAIAARRRMARSIALAMSDASSIDAVSRV
jgi:hypothetical protein